MLTTVCLLLGLLCVTYGQQNGAIMLYDSSNPESTTSRSGLVQIYYDGDWENVCSTTSFGQDEADVVCHQLGYTEATSFSSTRDAADSGGNGTFTNVQCSNSAYQVLLQCDFARTSDCNEYVTVDCSSTRVWDDPFTEQVRLSGGEYTNEGIVEIYCNNEWGTVCYDSSFDSDLVCEQLGYTDSTNLTQSTSNLSVWLNNVNCGLVQCLGSCQSCPSSAVTCTSGNVVEVQCSYNTADSNSRTLDSCDFTDLAEAIGNLIAIIVGVIVAVIACAIFWAVVPFCICCCLGVGICAAASKA